MGENPNLRSHKACVKSGVVDPICRRNGGGSHEKTRGVLRLLAQGTPLRSEIEARDASKLQAATDIVAEAIRTRHGSGPIEGKIQAIVIEARR